MKFFILFTVLLLAELIYFLIAKKFNIIDNPNERSSHKQITLRGGGIIFLFAAWCHSLFYGFQYPWFLAGITLVGTISFIDDIHALSDSKRLIAQFVAMFLMFQQLGILYWVNWWIVILAIIFCVGIINAYNFMDGVNGMTGGYSLAVVIPLIYINSRDEFIQPHYLYVMAISLLIFCFFNFRKKARCFAGDVGSISVAFLLIFAIGKLILKTEEPTYIMLLAIYGIDSILTIVHRILLHENIGQPHRKHLYQLMANELKIPHVIVSTIYLSLQLVISFGLFFSPINQWVYSIIILVLGVLCYIIIKLKYYHLHEEYLKKVKANC